MDALPVIFGTVMLVAGTAFAIAIGTMSGRDEKRREHESGS
jgi:hypothetical protein